MSGDLAGQAVGPPLPIQASKKVSSRYALTFSVLLEFLTILNLSYLRNYEHVEHLRIVDSCNCGLLEELWVKHLRLVYSAPYLKQCFATHFQIAHISTIVRVSSCIIYMKKKKPLAICNKPRVDTIKLES